MFTKKNNNKPLCIIIISMLFFSVALITKIATLVIQIVNKQFVLFRQINTSFTNGLVDIATICTTSSLTNNLQYACMKVQHHHLAYLLLENIMLIIDVTLLAIGCGFGVGLMVNLNKKQNKGISQMKLKQIILGIFSVDMVFACTNMAYLFGFYFDMAEFVQFSGLNLADYRNTFFISLMINTIGTVMLQIGYIMTFTLKTKKMFEKLNTQQTIGQNPTINYTVGQTRRQTRRQQESRQFLKQPNRKSLKAQDQITKSPNKEKREYKIQKKPINSNRPSTGFIEDIQQDEQICIQDNFENKKSYGGIIRQRPPLPTGLDTKNAYPKRQKPRFIKPVKTISAQTLTILNEAKYDSIHKPQQNQVQTIENINQSSQNSPKSSSSEQNNKQNIQQSKVEILNNKKISPDMVSITQNTEGHSNVDPTHLFIFKRSNDVSKYLKLRERWENN